MKIGDLVKLKFPRRRHMGDCGVIIEKDRLSYDASPNYFRVIWSISQNDTWLKQQQIEVINERTRN